MAQQFYAACLASYNNGVLHGRWIPATTDIDDMQAQIAVMLRTSPFRGAEEWAIHDSEGLGDIGDYEGLTAVAYRVALGDLAEEQGIPLSVVLQFASEYCSGNDAEEVEAKINDSHEGSYTNAGDWAAEKAEDLGYEVPGWIGCHVDWEGVARDMLMDYTSYEDYGTTYLFRP